MARETQPGVPGLVRVEDVPAAIHAHARRGWLGLLWPQTPPVSDAIDEMLMALGAAALRECKPDTARTPDAWTRAAKELLAAREPPIPGGFARELTVQRLIQWLQPRECRLALGVCAAGEGWRSVEIVAEWFARASGGEVLILVPGPPAPPREARDFRSLAEEKLWYALDQDAELHGLFQPNVRVMTMFQTAHCCDLVWREGKVIVEIDTYYTHGGPRQFGADRQRDYETLVTGYLTVRLLYEEVMSDCALAVRKVRRVVETRRQQRK
ncbi:MAG: DUF559 domain-containing protein [Bryobacteraceae bacterium]